MSRPRPADPPGHGLYVGSIPPPSLPYSPPSMPQPRAVRVMKQRNTFGFTLVGGAPVFVHSTRPGTPAEAAGLTQGDQLIGVNNVNVAMASHAHVVKLIQSAGNLLDLVVQYNPVLFEERTEEDESLCSQTSSPPRSAPHTPPRVAKMPMSPARRGDYNQSPLVKSLLRTPLAEGRPSEDYPITYLDGTRAKKPESPWSLLYVAFHMTEVNGKLWNGRAVPMPAILSVQPHRLSASNLKGHLIFSCTMANVKFTACGQDSPQRFAIVERESEHWDRCHVIEGDGSTIVNLLRTLSTQYRYAVGLEPKPPGYRGPRPRGGASSKLVFPAAPTEAEANGHALALAQSQKVKQVLRAQARGPSQEGLQAGAPGAEGREEEEHPLSVTARMPEDVLDFEPHTADMASPPAQEQAEARPGAGPEQQLGLTPLLEAEPEREPSMLVPSPAELGLLGHPKPAGSVPPGSFSPNLRLEAAPLPSGPGCVTILHGVQGASRRDILDRLAAMEPLCGLAHDNVAKLMAVAVTEDGPDSHEVFLRWGVDTCVTLHDVLYVASDRQSTLPLTRPANLLESLVMSVAISQGVGFLHGAGVTHGCLSPFSVRVNNDGILQLADMGMAPLLAQWRKDPVWEHYAAPESRHAPAASTSGDVFSMAVVIAEVAATVPKSRKARDGPAPSPPPLGGEPTVDKNLPSDLRTTLKSCWSASKDERPTADRMNILLTELLGDIDSSGSSSDEGGSADEVLMDERLKHRRQTSIRRHSSNAPSWSTPGRIRPKSFASGLDDSAVLEEEDEQAAAASPARRGRHRRSSYPPVNVSSEHKARRIYPKTPRMQPPPFPSPKTMQTSREMLDRISRLSFDDTSSGNSEREVSTEGEPFSPPRPAAPTGPLPMTPPVAAAVEEELRARSEKADDAAAAAAAAAAPSAGISARAASPEVANGTTAVAAAAAEEGKGEEGKKDAAEEEHATEEKKDEEEDGFDFFAMLKKAKETETQAALMWQPEDEHEQAEEDDAGITGPRRWALKFQYLMASEEGVAVFIQFLKTIFCEENCRFYLDAQAIKDLDDARFPAGVQQVYASYFAPKAKWSINADSSILAAINKYVQSDKPPRHTFALAQKQVYHLMKMDSYPKFLQSKYYKRALEATATSTTATAKKKPNPYYRNKTQTPDKKADRKKEKRDKKHSDASVSEGHEDKVLSPDGKDKKRSKVKGFFSALTKRGDKKRSGRNSANSSLIESPLSQGETARSDSVTNVFAEAGDIAPVVVAEPPETTPEPPHPLERVGEAEEEGEAEAEDGSVLFRAILPNQHRSVIRAEPESTLQEALGSLMDRFRLSPQVMSVFKADGDELYPWSTKVLQLQEQEVVLKPAAVIRLTFPDGTTSQIPVDPQQTIRDVLEPGYKRRGLTFESHPAFILGTGASHGKRVRVLLDGSSTTVANGDIVVDEASVSVV